jgi:NAD(P)H-hydrate epimerase
VAARGGEIVSGRAQGERIVVTAAEQRRIDALARAGGMDVDDLIESAGKAAAGWILDHATVQRAAVVAGPGGNGADALVVARRLLEAGSDVRAFLFAPSGTVSGPLKRALRRLQTAGGDVTAIDETDLGPLERALGWANAAIDGLYGSGLSRPPEGAAAGIVDLLNRAQVLTVSLDVPSGIQADVGDVPGPAVKADVTLAMEFLKPAHLLFPAAALCGRTEVVPVAYPEAVLEDAQPAARVLRRPGASRRLPSRPADGHKGTFGHVVLVAGSTGMMGAAILAGRAALRSGAGLLTLAVPGSQAPTVHAALPEALVVALAEESGCIAPTALADLAPCLDRASVLAIGPGLSRGAGTAAAVRKILGAARCPAVVDADALVALAQDLECVRALRGRAILTPHPGEFALLTGGQVARIDNDRIAAASRFACEHGVLLVLKGRPTAIGIPDGRVYLNPTGNSGLATGGSGDVLTGLIAGLVAGGASLEDAALVGPYVHGLAADLFAAAGSERSLLPSDVIDLLPQAFLEVETCA